MGGVRRSAAWTAAKYAERMMQYDEPALLSVAEPCLCGSHLSVMVGKALGQYIRPAKVPTRPPALPKPPEEVPLISSLDPLAPLFRHRVQALVAAMAAKGHDAMVFESYRTNARAEYLHGFGRRYDDGRGIVTNARHSWTTWHGYGLAVDVVSRAKLWGAPAKFWTDLRVLAREHSLTSGDDWDRDGIAVDRDPDESYSDRPHVQWWIPGMYKSPSATGQELLRTQGKEAVWRVLRAS